MEQSSSPSNLTRPRFITGERDILASVRVFPVNIRTCSVERNVHEMNVVILKLVDRETEVTVKAIKIASKFEDDNVHFLDI